MEIKFNRSACSYLRRVTGQLQTREQTQEVRLPEAMPDIGRVLGCWGQILIRGKEWRSSGMSVNGGVMATVLYAPEDGSEPRALETWIPFQLKWDFPETERDGFICVVPYLKSIDARSTSARKLMVRANVSAWGKAMENVEAEIYGPDEVPEDVQLLTSEYPMELPQESGEKLFQMEEELTVPDTLPAVEKILRYELTPRVLEQKVMASRLVFRGKGLLHILYCCDGRLRSWDCEVPFSQFADLDREYGPHSTAAVVPVLTNLELDMAEGRLMLKASVAAQYVIHDRVMVKVVEDAYSPQRGVQLQTQTLDLPMRLDETAEKLYAQQHLRADVREVADISFLADHPQRQQNGDMAGLSVTGQFQVLYYDPNGSLQSGTARCEQQWQIASDSENTVDGLVSADGVPQATVDGEGIELTAPFQVEATVLSSAGQEMVTGLELGEARQPDPGRPSLILRRCGDGSLWDMAKECGSTVEAIRRANGLQAEPESGRMLLIPVS